MFPVIYIYFLLLKFVSFKLEHFGILASCQIPSAGQMPPVKLVILIIEYAFSLLSSRLGYLEESRLRKRNKSEIGRERERGEERRVSNVSTSTKGLFWSGFNLNFYIHLSPDFLNQLHKISSTSLP